MDRPASFRKKRVWPDIGEANLSHSTSNNVIRTHFIIDGKI